MLGARDPRFVLSHQIGVVPQCGGDSLPLVVFIHVHIPDLIPVPTEMADPISPMGNSGYLMDGDAPPGVNRGVHNLTEVC